MYLKTHVPQVDMSPAEWAPVRVISVKDMAVCPASQAPHLRSPHVPPSRLESVPSSVSHVLTQNNLEPVRTPQTRQPQPLDPMQDPQPPDPPPEPMFPWLPPLQAMTLLPRTSLPQSHCEFLLLQEPALRSEVTHVTTASVCVCVCVVH